VPFLAAAALANCLAAAALANCLDTQYSKSLLNVQ